jgi:hypothetical protein
MHESAIRARAQSIYDELSSKDVGAARVKELSAEIDELVTADRTHKSALQWAGSADPNPYGHPYDGSPGGPEIAFKGFGPNLENRVRPTSMYEIDKSQIAALRQAALQGSGFKVAINQKGIEHGSFAGGQIRSKAAVTEGGLTPNLLPPIQQMGDRGWYGLPYELTRVANFIPNVAMTGPGIAYFRHDSNGVEAAYVAEGGAKPDLTPVVTEQYVRPAKAAGLVKLTHELVQDAGDEFTGKLVTDLARSIYNTESNLLLNGTSGANGFNGINQVAGTLTQALGADTPLDCLSKAFVALRNDFFIPDLVFIHPSTMGALRRIKDTQGRYLLQLMQGPGAINQTAEQEDLWGVPCVQTTQQAAGTAAVLSVQSGAAVVYVREALTTFYDPYTFSSTNVYQFIAETRLALATPRPSAICLCTGLPTS